MKPRNKPNPLLKKGHAHKSKRDYKRADRNTWADEINANPPNLNVVDYEDLPDKTGGHE